MKFLLAVVLVSIFSAYLRPPGGHDLARRVGDSGAAQFDFWLGQWELSWNDTGRGVNSITKEFGGHVIQENFYDSSSQFFGKSWSVYDSTTRLWKQTWVDNQGGYIVLSGKFENGKMTLATQPVTRKGKVTVSRMVFYNISSGSFDWNWEHSTDGGRNWALSWKIHYRRKI